MCQKENVHKSNDFDAKRFINYSKPEDITFHNIITEDSFTVLHIDNIFTLFESVDNIFILIFADKKKSIISYNLTHNNKISEIKNAHDNIIINIRYFFDIINKRDLVLTISYYDNNLKIWDITLNCLVNLKNINKQGDIYSGAILNYNNQIYIITSNNNLSGDSDNMKIFDFKGNKINEINDSNNNVNSIDIYYDNLKNKNYIITSNQKVAISFDFNENKIYHKYREDGDGYNHPSIILHKIDEKVTLIESSTEGNIKLWDFHSGDFLKKISVINDWIYGICMWNKDYLFVGCCDKTIKLININNGETVKSLTGHKNSVVTIKKIIHPTYGECLISFGGNIILWVKK